LTSGTRAHWPPELDLSVLSFFFHLAWEFLQAPLFSSMHGVSHLAGIVTCLQATLGDVAIALVAFWGAAVFAKSRRWFIAPRLRDLTTFLVIGIGITIGLEYLHTEITGRWTYGDQMPILPVLGTGLSPLMQWLIMPILSLWYLRRLQPTKPSQ